MEWPILYSFRRCPYAMRARLALHVAGQQCELREVVLKDKPAHMLSISPKGTVPVLLLQNGTVMDESLDIMDWALAQQDPQDWLKPKGGRLEETKEWVARCDGEFKHHLDRTKYATRYEDVDPESHRKEAERFLYDLNQRLLEDDYLFGKHLTYGDVAIAPFVRQFAFIDRNRFDASPFPALRQWLDAFIDSALFAAVMKKATPWKEGDAPLLFPFAEKTSES